MSLELIEGIFIGMKTFFYVYVAFSPILKNDRILVFVTVLLLLWSSNCAEIFRISLLLHMLGNKNSLECFSNISSAIR